MNGAPSQVTISCCGYQCHQGVPAPWQCPGCQKVHLPDDPPVSEPSGTLEQ